MNGYDVAKTIVNKQFKRPSAQNSQYPKLAEIISSSQDTAKVQARNGRLRAIPLEGQFMENQNGTEDKAHNNDADLFADVAALTIRDVKIVSINSPTMPGHAVTSPA